MLLCFFCYQHCTKDGVFLQFLFFRKNCRVLRFYVKLIIQKKSQNHIAYDRRKEYN